MAAQLHSTDHPNLFIAVADDCPVSKAEPPPAKQEAPSVAALQFSMLDGHPYELTSDDVVFAVHATRKGIAKRDWPTARAEFFANGQPCLRASPLTKRYGWGVHADAQGRIALVPLGSAEYTRLLKDKRLTQVKAMRSKRDG